MTSRNFAKRSKDYKASGSASWHYRIFSLILLISFLAVAIFLFRWQVVDNERYQALASTRFNTRRLTALRGDILASDGSVLSFSEPRFDMYVYMSPQQGLLAAENTGRQTREEFLAKVSSLLGQTKDELEKNLNSDSQWIRIATDVTQETKDLLLAIPSDRDSNVTLAGLDYEETAVRVYPESSLAAHVLGFLGNDDFGSVIGRNGIEQYFNGVLSPRVGVASIEADSNQNIIAISDNLTREAVKGTTVQTTIDKNIQAIVERRLVEAIDRYGAKSGNVIVADPRTGAIMAMANYPNFDPGNYRNVLSARDFASIGITNPYEIGSVGKIYTMAAAVDQKKVEPSTQVTPGHTGCQQIIEERIICTYDKKPKGPLNATQSMIDSDNLALFATAQLIGGEKLAEYLEKFGMGKKTNIQLSGEDSGYIKPGIQWNEADLAAYSYGHSYYQTTLQSVMGVAALANKGTRMEPMIVQRLIEADGSTREYKPIPVVEVVTPETTQKMGQILHEVYLNNLAENKYKELAKYYIGMKSGTALIPYSALSEPKQIPGYSGETNSTYVGYDASEKNSFIMLVNISEPQNGPKLSYYNARLLWLDIFAEIRNHIGVPVIE